MLATRCHERIIIATTTDTERRQRLGLKRRDLGRGWRILDPEDYGRLEDLANFQRVRCPRPELCGCRQVNEPRFDFVRYLAAFFARYLSRARCAKARVGSSMAAQCQSRLTSGDPSR